MRIKTEIRKGKALASLRALSWLALFGAGSALSAQTYTLTDIGTLPGGSSTIVKKINLGGDAVGQSGARYGERTHAFIRSGGKLLDLGRLPGGDYSSAFDINHRGAVVGDSNTATVIRARLGRHQRLDLALQQRSCQSS